MLASDQPIPVHVAYGHHIDPSLNAVFGFQDRSLALQIVSISFWNMMQVGPWFFQPQATREQRVSVTLSATNAREIVLPAHMHDTLQQLAEGISALDDVPCDGTSTVWPHLQKLDFHLRYLDSLSCNVIRDVSWIMAAAPALESVALYSPNITPNYVPTGLSTLIFTVQNKFATSTLQNNIAAANLRTLTIDGAHSTGSYDQPPAFQTMIGALLAAAPALVNLRELNVRGFGPKSCLADAVVALVALSSLRTVRFLVFGDGDVRREAALLSRILEAANIGLRTLGLICMTSPAQRRGPLPSFVVEVLAKARLPCLRTVFYAARRTSSGRLFPPLVTRPNTQKLKAVCMLRRMKLEVVELASNQTWPGDVFNSYHAMF